MIVRRRCFEIREIVREERQELQLLQEAKLNYHPPSLLPHLQCQKCQVLGTV